MTRKTSPAAAMAEGIRSANKADGKSAKKVPAVRAKAKPVDRAASIAASWKDPATATARATHTAVKVAGTVYRSVPTAFVELGLPLGRMGRFRLEVKAEGKATFVTDEGKKFNFVAVAAE